MPVGAGRVSAQANHGGLARGDNPASNDQDAAEQEPRCRVGKTERYQYERADKRCRVSENGQQNTIASADAMVPGQVAQRQRDE